MTVEQTLELAIQHHQAGRLAQAEALYRQVLTEQPVHPVALHLLGVLANQSGQPDKAIELINRALQIKPEYAEALINLGSILATRDRNNDAIAVFQKAVALRPRNLIIYQKLGIALMKNGQTDDAVASFRTAIQLDPNNAHSYIHLGQLLIAQRKLDESIAAYSKAISLAPEAAEAHNGLGLAMIQKNQPNEANGAFSTATRLNPQLHEAWCNLGDALCLQRRHEESLDPYARAIKLQPEDIRAYISLGHALTNLKRFDEALHAHRRAIELRADDPRAHLAIAETLLHSRELKAAEESFRRVISMAPDTATAWRGLGMVLAGAGRIEEARISFLRAVSLQPDDAMSYMSVLTRGQSVDIADAVRLTALLDKSDLPIQDRTAAAFALGNLYDRADRYDEAFVYFSRANSIIKEDRTQAGEQFDADDLHRWVDRIIKAYTPEHFARAKRWGNLSDQPVFVVGMPRSGTSLVEQICASHSKVFGAGELTDIRRLAESLGADDQKKIEQWNASDIATASDEYLERLQTLAPNATRIIDKMPLNIISLGFITTMFPAARVIFCRRDPRDNCLSCFFQWFTNANTFAFDLADCGHQYVEAERLRKHWVNVLPIKMLEVHNEALVADQEGESRRLIEFLGLSWEPACLDFHKTERPVFTASAWQVRQPIYTRSIGRWKHYEHHLAPLMKVLKDAAII